MWHLLCLVKHDTNHVVGVPQVAELGDLSKEVTDKADVVSFLEAQDVEDEYSRAMTGKNKAKGKDREKHDMRYFCF
ncbi:hypothetical protein ACFX19_036444 [Malus domestica]